MFLAFFFLMKPAMYINFTLTLSSFHQSKAEFFCLKKWREAAYILVQSTFWIIHTELFVLAGYLTDGTSSSQNIKMPLNQ